MSEEVAGVIVLAAVAAVFRPLAATPLLPLIALKWCRGTHIVPESMSAAVSSVDVPGLLPPVIDVAMRSRPPVR